MDKDTIKWAENRLDLKTKAVKPSLQPGGSGSLSSVLGPISFNIFIDNLHDEVGVTLSWFAGDTRQGCSKLERKGCWQRDLDRLEKWLT